MIQEAMDKNGKTPYDYSVSRSLERWQACATLLQDAMDRPVRFRIFR